MVSTAEDLDLETLARMGIRKDPNERYRIGYEDATRMGVGGGRWVTTEERGSFGTATKGYTILPEGLKDGTFTKNELYRLAVEAGTSGIPDSDNLADTLGTLFQAIETEQELLVRDAKDLVRTQPGVALASALRADYLGRIMKDIKQRLPILAGNGQSLEKLAYSTAAGSTGAAA
ncbi:MAG: hypothetical protein V1702_04920 [Candidatus Woesearchaeota archaeon]